MNAGKRIEPTGTPPYIQPKPASKLPACADCKRLKVKCVRSQPNNPNSVCERCLKKGINCVISTNVKRPVVPAAAQPPPDLEGAKRRKKALVTEKFTEQVDSLTMRDQLLSSWKLLSARDDLRLQLLEKYETKSLARPANNVLRTGFLTRPQIVQRLRLYMQELYPKFPVVDCPTGDDYDEFMDANPILFHAILDIGSIMVADPGQLETSLVLHNLVLRTVIDEIMIVSVKNMELLKCLILLTHWYNESELYHQQRLHVITALAGSVSYDLGLGGVGIIPQGTSVPAFEQMVSPHSAADYQSVESYRIWLSVYASYFQQLIANRRPVKENWNKYCDEAVAALAKDEELAIAENRKGKFGIWELAKLKNIQERIAIALFKKNNDPVAPDYNDPVTLFNIQQFDAEIGRYRASTPHRTQRCDVILEMCTLFLHQGVMYVPYNENVGRAPFTNLSLDIFKGPLSYEEQRSFRILVDTSKALLDDVNTRSTYSVASSTSDFWTSMTLCCDILLKCRSCCIFNRHFAATSFVGDYDIARILQFTSLCDRVTHDFPNCNNALSFGFFVKLILCHHDARVHYHSSSTPLETLGDPFFIMRRSGQDSSATAGRVDNDVAREAEYLPATATQVDSVPNNGMPTTATLTRSENNNNNSGINSNNNSNNNSAASRNDSGNDNTNIPSAGTGPYRVDEQAILEQFSDPNGFPGGTVDPAETGQQPYSGSPYSPMSITPMKQQGSDQPDDLDETLDFTTMNFDLTALNENENFWNNFVASKGPFGPFGLDFPV